MANRFLFAVATLALTASASAQMRITEYMYNGAGSGTQQNREYVEFTNVGGSPINMAGWSFDDNSRTAGSFDLSAFGIVLPGQSIILAEQSAAIFRSDWSLPASVVVIGGNTQNLGRADEINLYDNTSTLIDRLTYDDQTIAGSVRANGVSAWTTSALGTNNAAAWQLSVQGDAQSSYLSGTANGPANLGNPGTFLIPEPTTIGLLILGAAALRRRVK